jgi:hypothetical protein
MAVWLNIFDWDFPESFGPGLPDGLFSNQKSHFG